MPRKIIDISPPKAKLPKIEIEKKEKKEKKKIRFSLWWKILIVLLVIFGLGFVLLERNAKLTLKIQPRLKEVSFEETFEVVVGETEVKLGEKIIPGKFFEKEVEKWKQFESTGISQKSGKAKGRIKVYNSHTPVTSLTLRVNTRFLSSKDGKVFRSLKKIYLPPAKIIQGKVVPSVVEVSVEAQEPGEEYNIGPSKFSVPGLVGTPYYYTIYGESDSPMSGGFKTETKVISEEDLENAKNSLLKVLREEAKKSLRNEIAKNFVLLDDAISKEQSKIYCLQKAGQEYAEFSCQGEIKIKGIAFKLSDLKEIAADFVRNNISSSEKLLVDSLDFQYLSQTLILEKGKMILEVMLNGRIFKDIPVLTLKEQIKGKSKGEIEKIISTNYPQVDRLSIEFWPFWLRNAPKSSKKIDVEFTF